MPSEFEEAAARRKKAERKKRQEFLYDQIAGYKMASFTFEEARWLNKFFDMEEPTDANLAEATDIIQGHVSDIAEFWGKFREKLPPSDDTDPSQ